MAMENLAWLGPKEFVGSALKSWRCQLRNPVGSLLPVSIHGDLGG